jgi:hypothetical protein
MPRGISFAIPFALGRGHAMVFVPSRINIGDFLISGNGLFVLGAVRFARRLRASVPEIEKEYMATIAELRQIPRNGPVACELWLYSRYGTLRIFRVHDDTLEEVDLYGMPPGTGGVPVNGSSYPAGEDTKTNAGTPAPGPVPAGSADPRGPILRWLAKWNAARREGKGGDATGGNGLKEILDAGGPGTRMKRTPSKCTGGGTPAPAVGTSPVGGLPQGSPMGTPDQSHEKGVS